MHELTATSPKNVQKPCLCVLALDVSSSMEGTPIIELNNALQEFYNSINQDDEAAEKLEICLITFGSNAKCIQEPAKVDDFKMPPLVANGTTKLVDGINLAIKQVELRKEYYKKYSPQYSRPMILVFTDGEPDADQDMIGLATQIRNDMFSKKYTFHVLGTTGYNHSKVLEFCPKELVYSIGTNYSRFFKWLSSSMDGLIAGQTFDDMRTKDDFMQQRPIN
ncbi:MAG: VWA domain-containing protein [Ginsengibacter sp.]